MATVRQVRQNLGNTLHRGKFVFILQLFTFLLCLDVILCKDYCKGTSFTKCICTDDYVECHNQTDMTDITKLYPEIKDNIKYVSITGSNFTELPQNFLGSCRHDPSLVLHKLKAMDISNNQITRVHGKSFHCTPNLENLTLSENKWRIDYHSAQTGYFTSLPHLKHLDMTNAFDEIWNGSIHVGKLATIFRQTDMTNLLTLKLGYNEFFTFSLPIANSFCNLTSLRYLDLSHNNLDSPSLPTTPNCLEKLEVLNLANNSMPVIPKEFLNKIESLKNLKEVHLNNNPYICDCGLLETWHWLNSTKVPVFEKNSMKCAAGFHSSYIGKSIVSLQPSDLKCLSVEAPSNTAVKAVTGIIFTVIALVIVGFVIVNRAKLGLMCKRWRKKMPKWNLRMHTGYSTVQEVAFVEKI